MDLSMKNGFTGRHKTRRSMSVFDVGRQGRKGREEVGVGNRQ